MNARSYCFSIALLLILFGFQHPAYSFFSADESCCNAQFDSLSGKQVCLFAPQMPEFPGGEAELMKFLQSRIRITEENRRQSTFYLAFVVNEQGKVIGGRIKNKRPEAYIPTEQAMIQHLDSMPVWKPGMCGGEPVAVLMQIPVRICVKE